MVSVRDRARQSTLLRPLRMARLRRFARTEGHENWPALIGCDMPAWEAALRSAKGGPRVLIATSIGGHFALNAIDRLLTVALTLRGAEVRIALCDRLLSGCQMAEANLFPDQNRFVEFGPQRDLCSYCYSPSRAAYAQIGIPVLNLGDFLTPEDLQTMAQAARAVDMEEIGSFSAEGLALGEHALAGALRFFARGDLATEPHASAVAHRYLTAALQSATAYRRILEYFPADVVVAHHGVYVPQGVAVAVARQIKRRVVVWNPAYRKHCFMFSHDDTYHHTMMNEPVATWRDGVFSAESAQMIESYLRSRWDGGRDWIRFHRDPDYRLTKELAMHGLDIGKPIVLALTNVFWDAQLHYPTNAFRSQLEWLCATIEWFAARADLQLVVRIHPAELSGVPASRQHAADEIARAFPVLPPNVRVIPPSSAVSTYVLAQSCDCALIYATKTGVELASMGIPVVVAGEAWVRNKGFTHDARSPEHYRELLARLPFGERLSAEMIELARRYAFHFFFRRMIPLDFVQPIAGPRRFATRIDGLGSLRPGANPGLDAICQGILTGTPFHMPHAAALIAGATV